MSVAVWVALALLGGVGALLRFRLDEIVQLRVGGEFPVGTLVVNVTGSFALGMLAGAGIGGDALLLGGTATLGSFTTFSTWIFETERLAEDGDGTLALVNIGVSIVAGLAAALAGWEIGEVL